MSAKNFCAPEVSLWWSNR